MAMITRRSSIGFLEMSSENRNYWPQWKWAISLWALYLKKFTILPTDLQSLLQWLSSRSIQISWAHGRLANLTHGNQGWDAALVALLSFVSWAIILETVHHLRQSLALLTQDQESSLIINIFCSVFQSEPYKSFLLSFSIFVFFSLLSFCHCVFCLRLIPSRKILLEKSRPDNPLFVGSQCGDGPTVSQVLNVSSMMCLLSTNPITAVIALS